MKQTSPGNRHKTSVPTRYYRVLIPGPRLHRAGNKTRPTSSTTKAADVTERQRRRGGCGTETAFIIDGSAMDNFLLRYGGAVTVLLIIDDN